jgi:hypothetical protein
MHASNTRPSNHKFGGNSQSNLYVLRAQGTTEYLIILAVVIVIALIVVSIMGWMPGMGATITEKQSSTYWASLSPLAITSYAVFSDGSIQFAVRNSSMQTQTLSAIYLNDENALKAGSVTIQPASTSTVYGYVTNSANRCTAGTTFTYNVKLKYGSQYLQNKSLIGEKPLVGECISGGTTNGLVAVWHFDEGSGSAAYDCSGNANDGAINGATWTTGKIGKALQFDGSNDYVSVSHSASLMPSAITVSVWIKLNDNGRWMVVDKGTNHPGTYYMYGDAGTQVIWTIKDGTNRYDLSYSNLVIGNWYHLVGTFDGSIQKLYVNGDEKGSRTASFGSNTQNLWIGKYQGGGSYDFNGIIDEVRIYNRALSADEVLALYNAGR